MADTKISALTSATTPLDGTEVLPIVQSSTTKKVANNDLRPKQIQSNATSGVMQIVGPAAAATRVMTIPDANFTAARTDAAQTFTGDQTIGGGLFSVTKSGVPQIKLQNTSGTTKNTQIYFSDSVGSKFRIGMDIATNNNTENFQIYSDTGSASYITLSSSGVWSFDVGNANFKTAGKGIVFEGNGSVLWRCGSGTPEGSVTAPVGSLYTRTDGGANTTLYVKESGVGNTGWIAK